MFDQNRSKIKFKVGKNGEKIEVLAFKEYNR